MKCSTSWTDIRKGQIGIQDFHSHQPVMKPRWFQWGSGGNPGLPCLLGSNKAPSLCLLGWCQRRPSKESGISPLPSGSTATPTVVSGDHVGARSPSIQQYFLGDRWRPSGNLNFYLHLTVMTQYHLHPLPEWYQRKPTKIEG